MRVSARALGVRFTALLLVTAALAACGGGGEDSGATGATNATPASTSSSSAAAAGSSSSSSAAANSSSSSSAPGNTTNAPPTLTGTAATSVVAGSAYSFAPVGADANGDALTYSIQNKPSWASFNTTNGQLTGTPVAANAGSFANIVISVTDGKASTALSSFAITVTQANSGSVALTWTVPMQNTDGSPLTNLAGYKIYYGNNAGALSQTVQGLGANQVSTTVTGLSSGTWYFSIASYNSANVESDRSGVASAVVL